MGTEQTFPKKPLNEVLPIIHQEGFIAYCGAGISIPAPTCAPSWWTLTDEILTAFFESVPAEYELPKDIIIKDQMFTPEAIFEIFGTVLGDTFFETFQALDVAEPNENHKLIARLAREKVLKACFTTNFDIYIERALKQEGVPYQLLVENHEYEALIKELEKGIMPEKFLLCKIHGTIDKPESIIALASAYKGSKGFSTTKSDVLHWLLERYSCLFLGYSGWDFEHANYRKFWDRTGPQLKGLYWNRRPNEEGGPNFPIIFNSCQQKFVFSEADLPNNWLEGLEQLQLVNLDNIGLTKLTPEAESQYWESAKSKRVEYFNEWAKKIPEFKTLSLVISEGVHFSAKFKESRDKAIALAKGQATGQTSFQAQGPDPNLALEMGELGGKLSKQEITAQEYQSRMQELQLEMSLTSVPPDKKTAVKELFTGNAHPGTTDNPQKSSNLAQKISRLIRNYDVPTAAKIAVDLVDRDFNAMTKGTDAYIAETMITMWLAENMQPSEEEWKPSYEKIEILKTKFIAGEMGDQAAFRTAFMELSKKAKYKEMGFDAPVELWIEKLVEKIGQCQTREEFIQAAEAFNTAIVGVYARINADLFSSPEYKALQQAVNSKPPSQAVIDPAVHQELNANYAELGQKFAKKEITQQEYTQEVQRLQREFAQKTVVPVSNEAPPDVPLEILQTYNRKIRAPYQPVFDKLAELYPEEISYPKMLIELAIMSLWIAGSQMIYTEKAQQYYPIANQGLYPIIETHPSIQKYLKDTHLPWINAALEQMDRTYGQTMCRFVLELGEMSYDLDLMKRATDKSIEYEEGKVDESTYMRIPIVLAAYYEKEGNKEEALRYYTIGLEALRSQFIPPFADILVYRTAVLLAETDKVRALKTLILGFPEYLGNEPPMKFPAREIGLKYADQLARELGHSSVEEAIQKYFSE